MNWQFEGEAVQAFLRQKAEERARIEAERATVIGQLALPIGHNGGPPLDSQDPPQLKPVELLALCKLRKLQREEEYELGRLVRVAELKPVLGEAVALLATSWRTMARRFGEERGWSEHQIAELRAATEAFQRRFVDDLNRVMRGGKVSEPELDLSQAPVAAE